MIRWAVYDDGLKSLGQWQTYCSSPTSDFKYILSDLALWLRHNDKERQEDG
jgi:hypothetical protein